MYTVAMLLSVWILFIHAVDWLWPSTGRWFLHLQTFYNYMHTSSCYLACIADNLIYHFILAAVVDIMLVGLKGFSLVKFIAI